MKENEISMLAKRLRKENEELRETKELFQNGISLEEAEQLIRMYLDDPKALKDKKEKLVKKILQNNEEDLNDFD